MELSLPSFEYKVRKQNDVIYIYDMIRKKYIVLTPEEWVRQHFVHYLINCKKYPLALISVEREIEINGLKRRFDIVCFDRKGHPYLIVECKAPEITLSQAVFDQVFEYNSILNARYAIVTNGIRHLCGSKNENGQFSISREIPFFINH